MWHRGCKQAHPLPHLVTAPSWEVSPLPGLWKLLIHETGGGMKMKWGAKCLWFPPIWLFFACPCLRAEVTCELCVSAEHFVIPRPIATLAIGFFILYNGFKTCRIHEVDVGFGGFPMPVSGKCLLNTARSRAGSLRGWLYKSVKCENHVQNGETLIFHALLLYID